MASIHKLPTDVVNRIAAGEVVQRPSAALKELLENAIDAGCTRVQVLVAEGGLEVLQVSDDGSGIHREDLPLLCERYATSKLQSFEDLQRVTSFGFRGEALASISYVSRVTVTTRRRPSAEVTENKSDSATSSTSSRAAPSSQVAWRAQYVNGSLTGDPQPCAGNYGTTIRAEKLFYNALVRRNSLRASEEWGRIVDVVSRYALAYPEIGFTCQRDGSYGAGGGSASRSGAGGAGGAGSGAAGGNGGVNFSPNATTRQNIRVSHGPHVASHLRLMYAYNVGDTDKAVTNPEETATACYDREGHKEEPPQSSSSSNGSHGSAAQETRVFAEIERRARQVRVCVGPAGEGLFTLTGLTSDPTLAQRKPYLCLFINQRLVESTAIRKAIESVYSGVLTGGNRPFTVLFLSVPTDRVDVNVHPTKKEVYLLDEELLVARVSEVCRGAVLEAAAARQMDMLKMRHTTAVALKQLPLADGTGGSEGRSVYDSTSGSSSQHILEKLRDQHRRGEPMASPLTSSTLSSGRGGGGGSNNSGAAGVSISGPAVVAAPCTMVRVEPQKGALDRFFAPRLAAATAAAAVEADATATGRASQTSPNGAHAPSDISKQEQQTVPEKLEHAAKQEDARASTGSSPFTTAASDAAPSLDAVIASLHRATVVDDDHSTSTYREQRLKENEATATAYSVVDNKADGDDSDEQGATVPLAPSAAALAFHVPSVKRERRASGNDSGAACNSLESSSTSSGDGDDEDAEDRMREFKRHRRDVYERVEEELQRQPISMVVAAEGSPSTPDTHLLNLPPDTTMRIHETSTAVKEEVGTSCTRKEDASTQKSAAAAATTNRTKADDNKEEATMARLGAVARASDLLRTEAATVHTSVDSAKASHAHVLTSSDDDDGKVSVSGEVARHTTGSTNVDSNTSLVTVAEVSAPAVLSSVSIIVDRIVADSTPTAAALLQQLSYVGVVDAQAFLAQVGTTLVWCDTMTLVRQVVFQRVFLRWGQPSLPAPPTLGFDIPVPLAELLATALAHDAPLLQPPTAALWRLAEECRGTSAQVESNGFHPAGVLAAEAMERMGGMSARAWRRLLFHTDHHSAEAREGGEDGASEPDNETCPPPKPATQRYIRRLIRRLCRWRDLLKEYFFVDLTSDGTLVGLPYGLNRHWPPLLRALPLTMWRLAEAVPYPTPAADEAFVGATLTSPNERQMKTEPAVPSSRTSMAVTPVSTQATVEAEADGVAQEVACFTAIARHLADTLYGLHPPPPPPAKANTASTEGRNSGMAERPASDTVTATAAIAATAAEAEAEASWREELVQHGLFPCLKNAQLFRLPDHCVRDGTIQSMVSVESLYKVFERC